MFVSGGENIYPGDVERMLERHPAVAQACVVPIDDAIKGQKPVAFIIAKKRVAGGCRGDQAICARQRARLPAPALRLVRRPPAAVHDQQDRSRRARRVAAAHLAEMDGTSDAMTQHPDDIDRRLPVGDEIFLDHVGAFRDGPR